MRFVLIAVLAAAQIAAGSPALSLIQDTLYKADGTRFEGVAQIEWKSFRSADGTEVPQQTVSVKITLGQLRAQLVPTTNISNPVTYTVKFNSDGRTQFIEYWAVPPSSTALRLKDIRAQPIAGPITSGGGTIADILGLRNELDVRPAKGSGFIPSRAAVINTAGALDGAVGDPSDCIRVDGTSGPCGVASQLTFIDAEVPGGTMNGVNRYFTLAAEPATPGSLHLFRNGVLMKQGIGYSLSGTTITMHASTPPLQGDVLLAYYRLAASGTDTIQFSENETPAGAVDGSNAQFTLQTAPLPASSLQMFRNGILQKEGLDYTLNGSVLVFVTGTIPQPGDVLQASYRR
ncbi:MAG TPA: hypothetical protein VER03_05320 [Bryobacteraceae bacterium]|nr:hypothetical protein [Bryobacteraceae bacterium]